MNNIAELWSLPWHELQRCLAEDFGASAAGQPGAGGSRALKDGGSPGAGMVSPVGSWLARAAPGRGTGWPQNNCRTTAA